MGGDSALLPNYTFFIQLGLFFVCYFFLNRFVFSPYLSLLEERKGKTTGLKEQAERDKAKAEELKSGYESYLKEERKKLKAWYEAERKTIEESSRKGVETTRVEANAYLRKQKEVHDEETRKVLGELESKVPDFTSQILEKILGKKITLSSKAFPAKKQAETRV